jgi:hypothetical protein
MNPAIDHLRPRGWRNAQSQQVTPPPFQANANGSHKSAPRHRSGNRAYYPPISQHFQPIHSPPQQHTRDHEGAPAEGHVHVREPRGRKHQRSHSTPPWSEERPYDERRRSLGPPLSKRNIRRQSQPPEEGIIHSAKRMSRDFLASPCSPGHEEKNRSERYRYVDCSGPSRLWETTSSRPATPFPGPRSQRHRSGSRSRSHDVVHAAYLSKDKRSRQAQSRDSAQLVSPMQARTAQNTTGDGPHTRSDLSDLDGNLEISRMNGLLDIWDSTANPNWEEETFALCNLEHCRRCGKYYVLMRTLRHRCRK